MASGSAAGWVEGSWGCMGGVVDGQVKEYLEGLDVGFGGWAPRLADRGSYASGDA
jgi:hypothetical protein